MAQLSRAAALMFERLRARYRKAMNLDGPWLCVTCGTWTVVLQQLAAGGDELRCIGCGRLACGCEHGWGVSYFDPECEHHGPSPEVRMIEEVARELSSR